MNSYPVELLAQLAPVMFVAGLGGAPVQQEISPRSPPPPPPPKTQDPFALLISRLRETLQSQLRPSIWGPERNKSFQMVLVEKNVRFPPRKLVSPEDPSYTSAHSPLSPLTPSSPLHPDGLIAPIWIRKHMAFLPSVFVLFLRMFEAPNTTQRSPLDTSEVERGRDRVEEERKRDAEISAEIAQRKKTASERGIKLTVVLLASRRMLDDPSLDSRLSYIRKQSGLDSKAALFVLSPVSQAELDEFARRLGSVFLFVFSADSLSLQDALYEPAVEYYTSHSKRVRRKRNRHSQASTYNPPPLILSALPVHAHFAQKGGQFDTNTRWPVLQNSEVKTKHYQDAYTTLMIMFGSTAILPPRTKRWAEAKVLADTINFKVWLALRTYVGQRSYASSDNEALPLQQRARPRTIEPQPHMRRFADFSRGWGIGEETFEYWSWMARQHRVLAELLEQGSQSTLTFPTHVPLTRASGASLASAVGPSGAPLDVDAIRTLGLNPSHALQHPGHYYYMAARCTEARRERFLASESASQGINAAPGYANEKKVDHLTIVLELYTKSYELFKKYSSTASQGRLTLWIASRIAQTYYQSGKFELAIRFFERIAKTYRREKWNAMLRPLFLTWYACAKKLGDVELTVRLLVEMIGYGDIDEPGSLQDDLLTLLKTSVPFSNEALVVDLKESEPILNTSVVFWKPDVRVGEGVAFQISLAAPSDAVIPDLPIHSISILFSEGCRPITIHHDASAQPDPVRLVPLGQVRGEKPIEVQVHLRWRAGDQVVLAGTLASDVPGISAYVSSIVVTLKEGSWTIEVPHEPCASRESILAVPRWLSSVQPVTFIPVTRDDSLRVIVRHRPHQFSVSFSHQEPALLDEAYPIVIEITNTDDRALDIVVDVLLQPTEVDEAVQFLTFDGQKSSGLIKGVQFGTVQPGVSVVKTMVLVSSGAPGDRTIDISVQSRTTTEPVPSQSRSQARSPSPSLSETLDASQDYDMGEVLRTLLIPTSSVFVVHQDVAYQRSLRPPPALADLFVLEDPHGEARAGGEAVVMTVVECAAPCGVELEKVALHRLESRNARVVDTTLEAGVEGVFPGEYLTGDQFSDICLVELASTEDDTDEVLPGPGKYELTWKRILSPGHHGPRSSTYIPLPLLRPPRETLVALLSVPATAKLHTPNPIHLTVRNRRGSRSAVISVALDLQPSDGFVVAGLKSGRLPLVLPGTEERVTWNVIPIECGYVKVPRVKVMDHRRGGGGEEGAAGEKEGEGEVVRVVDVRFERWEGEGPGEGDVGTILVLP
ncbi:Gryzun, putative trafficking through golgi-domain-containing protein [Boletus reticuloceps]|uniref:Gryzun, putative trafficking through golgi-domain-containing protein n=1 Tax=Boletus reticuloceps TaxID=495285 RepID=A0A8I2Z1Y6_9AGAM|nr:Gryzun, putative trafficking through golgi-domain-containing protein [Boletus reticuloceps]